MRRRGCRQGGLAVAVATLALGCLPGPPPRRNVLLIVVDTLRQDHVGSYGWKRDTTPAIDALARDGVRFERAYATAPWTTPSVASMFTGLHPSSHGVRQIDSRLPDAATTLAEVLRDAGYRTAATVSHLMLGPKYHFDQGFEEYRQVAPRDVHDAVSTGDVTRNGQELLEGFAAGGEPFFLFLHYFDPHYHYKPHPTVPYAPARAGRLDGSESIWKLRELLREGGTAEELRFIVDLYDEEIRHTDEGIGRLLDTLRGLGLYDETVIAVTGDHGEEFLSHGWLGHGRTLYDELVRVPLVLRPPGHRGGGSVVEAPVSLASLPATLLELAGVGASGPLLPGDSLVPLLSGEEDPEAVVFSEVDMEARRAHKKAIATRRFKLIRDDRSGRIELYDLAADPGERHDLARVRQDVVRELLPVLEQRVARARGAAVEAERQRLSDEDREALHALGYVD